MPPLPLKKERNKKIKLLRRTTKMPLKAIGNIFGITKQRVKQILENRATPSEDLRGQILKRDNYSCRWKRVNACSKRLHIHHKDLNPGNNKPSNLITVCSRCHREYHKSLNPWSKYGRACKICGRDKHKHYEKGLCIECHKMIIEQKKQRWPRMYDKCVKCGTKKLSHHSFGLCTRCYSNIRLKNFNYKDQIAYYLRNRKKLRAKMRERYYRLKKVA